MKLTLGKTIELQNFRMHRFANSIKAVNLQNANKRGKKCNEFVVYNNYLSDVEAKTCFDLMANLIENCQSSKELEHLMKSFSEGKNLSAEHRELRGVDVAPSNKDFQEIVYESNNVSVKLEWDTFSIRDKKDQSNLPTIINVSSGANARKFHKTWEKNYNKFKSMTFNQIHSWFTGQDYTSKSFIKFHYYCAMD